MDMLNSGGPIKWHINFSKMIWLVELQHWTVSFIISFPTRVDVNIVNRQVQWNYISDIPAIIAHRSVSVGDRIEAVDVAGAGTPVPHKPDWRSKMFYNRNIFYEFNWTFMHALVWHSMIFYVLTMNIYHWRKIFRLAWCQFEEENNK